MAEETSAAHVRVSPADAGHVREVWAARWGLPIVTVRRSYRPGDVEGLVALDGAGRVAGLVTWFVEPGGAEAEVVSLDVLAQGTGVGGRLLAEAEGALRGRGVVRLSLVTTNDNPRALGFYVRRGYRLVRLHLDDLDRVRRLKPSVPEVGEGGIALRDMWELEKALDCLDSGKRDNTSHKEVSNGA